MSETSAPAAGTPADDPRDALEAPDVLDDLVDEWLTLPDVADRLGIDVMRARQLVRERRVLAVPHGERGVRQVPALLLVGDAPAAEVIPALQGTVILLDDAGFTDEEILAWLFSTEPALGTRPVDALRAGQRAAVRRVAQGLG